MKTTSAKKGAENRRCEQAPAEGRKRAILFVNSGSRIMYLVQEEDGIVRLLFRAISHLETLEVFSPGPSPNKDVR